MSTDLNAPELFATFLEAVKDGSKGQMRTQWFVMPPSTELFGSKLAEGAGRYLKRQIERAGHKAKWVPLTKPTWADLTVKLAGDLDQYATTGWEIRQPVVIRLEGDDYRAAMVEEAALKTPYKALRHVEAVTMRDRGYRLIG